VKCAESPDYFHYNRRIGQPHLNFLDQPGTDSPNLSFLNQPGTESPSLNFLDQPGTDSPNLNFLDQPGTDSPNLICLKPHSLLDSHTSTLKISQVLESLNNQPDRQPNLIILDQLCPRQPSVDGRYQLSGSARHYCRQLNLDILDPPGNGKPNFNFRISHVGLNAPTIRSKSARYWTAVPQCFSLPVS
jgi:hypothetical protein